MTAQELNPCPSEYSLLTDLYQLTMAACYWGEGIAESPARFELFTRHLPNDFGYLIAMGLEQVLEYLEQLQFTPENLAQLQATEIFKDVPKSFWSLLEAGKFSGDVWALPEGTAVFAQEPILRVEAPLWQAQLVETYLLNTINYQTLIASRAARMRSLVGETSQLLEFGSRRAFSPQGALWAARAALGGGFNATSNVLAAVKLGVKPVGTMAHALVMAMTATNGSETEAFKAFHRYFPQATLLIDTYDPLEAATNLARRVKEGEIPPQGVRLDSGDLVVLSQKIKSLLPQTKIYGSGDLDEQELERLQAAGAVIDGYGIGTKLVTGSPVNGVYKLVEIAGIPTMKQSQGKGTYPGAKQIYRCYQEGKISSDRLALTTEAPLSGEEPMLKLVMSQGKAVNPPESLSTIQARTLNTLKSLPPSALAIKQPQPLPVVISPALQSLQAAVIRDINAKNRSLWH